MCVYVYVYMCVYIYICVFVYICVDIYIYVLLYKLLPGCTYLSAITHLHINIILSI